MPVLFCSGNFYASGIAGDAEAALQNKIHSIHRNFVFLLGNFWSGQTYSRFYATLPQEFGMIFVIPSIYFLIRFFQIPKQKLADKETRLTLQCFAMAFSLTLAIHFMVR